MPNSDMSKTQEKSIGEAPVQSGDEGKQGGEVISESSEQMQKLSRSPNNYHVQDNGAASHDVEIEDREEYLLK